MLHDVIEIGEEVGARKTFLWVIDWPGWCRSGKDGPLAIDALIDHGPRYAHVAAEAGTEAPTDASARDLSTVESVSGNGGTDFGVPSIITERDARPVDAAMAARFAAIVGAAWTLLDRLATTAPPELRKGPRGGGRDRDKVIAHVIGADHAYAREIGLRLPEPTFDDRAAVEAERAAILEVIGRPSDGSPLADRRWTQRYAARRIAWHALDHVWEIEDRSEPA
ncbi:MAG TPA: hypothetical protein VD763_02475 [Candidatus Saccharimonadales bacterium]|nr:hypothetical protein [Candidatus Saccharimonadales bacterium]